MQEKTCKVGHNYDGPRCLECKRAKDREIKARKRAEAKAAAEAPVEAAPVPPAPLEAPVEAAPVPPAPLEPPPRAAAHDLGRPVSLFTTAPAQHMTAVRNSGLNRQARRGLASRLRRRKERNPDLIWAAATLSKHCENFRRWIRRVTFTLSPIGAT